MKTFVELDVSQKKMSACVIENDGNKIRMVNVDTHPDVIARYYYTVGSNGKLIISCPLQTLRIDNILSHERFMVI